MVTGKVTVVITTAKDILMARAAAADTADAIMARATRTHIVMGKAAQAWAKVAVRIAARAVLTGTADIRNKKIEQDGASSANEKFAGEVFSCRGKERRFMV